MSRPRQRYKRVPVAYYDALVEAAGRGRCFDSRRNRGADELRLWDWVQLVDDCGVYQTPVPRCDELSARWGMSRSAAARWMRAHSADALALARELGTRWVDSDGNWTRFGRDSDTKVQHSDNDGGQERQEPEPKVQHSDANETRKDHGSDEKVEHARIETNANATATATKKDVAAPTLPLTPSSATPDGAASGVLSDRTRATLQRHGVDLDSLKSQTASDLLKLKGVGKRTIQEVKAYLSERGEQLQPEPESAAKKAHRFRQVWLETYQAAMGIDYVCTPGDIHQTSRDIATSLTPDLWAGAVAAYLRACRAGEVWAHRETPPTMRRFSDELTRWAGQAAKKPEKVLSGIEHNKRWHELPKLPPRLDRRRGQK